MVREIEGIVEDKGKGKLVIKVGGVGIEVLVPSSDGVEIGERVKLYTHLKVKDDITLYGFFEKDSLFIFEELISVPGVGPKNALSILSSMDAHELMEAVSSEDVDRISSVPGIGRKLASKIILELKGKMPRIEDENKEVIEALKSLGYSVKEIIPALSGVPRDKPVEERVKLALKNLMR